MRKKTLYVGLHRYLEEFCEERDYNLLSDINLLPKYDDDLVEGMLEETTLPSHISPRDYQLNALRHAIRSSKSLLLSPTIFEKTRTRACFDKETAY